MFKLIVSSVCAIALVGTSAAARGEDVDFKIPIVQSPVHPEFSLVEVVKEIVEDATCYEDRQKNVLVACVSGAILKMVTSLPNVHFLVESAAEELISATAGCIETSPENSAFLLCTTSESKKGSLLIPLADCNLDDVRRRRKCVETVLTVNMQLWTSNPQYKFEFLILVSFQYILCYLKFLP
ncbi:hypothetical protein SARC_12461 [Sphaeroforma arctica JP610]|uniref:Uncharacterized protein n=1 Tax=Sphaeroforma arctica JP610 TaxID=667725 RepID=A0A0L0FEV4_9EUKA|nr:hypothetical protein SARC_12461 [Sphaeroforma arctica JP610]KNC75006.1 hypothetical protein SARC_12461 [Sphaeroforma arctica JP610]|eukprot:XP_014148908.1 hypothetical protein SARC_12461 [Sphaeroforma arctica JP610]